MKASASRSLTVFVGVLVLATGLSLTLEGSPLTLRKERAAEKPASGLSHRNTVTKVKEITPDRTVQSVSAETTSRIQTGTIPNTGLQVLSIDYVDWRDDEGTRLRRAGKLIGPLPSSSMRGGVAAACSPGSCSFNIQCDDNNACTIDRCDFGAVVGACAGTCVHDPVADNAAGECDDAVFCNGKETCQGAVCEAGSNRNVGLPCDSHADCGLPGSCDFNTNLCLTGNNPDTACTTHSDCDIRGTCAGGPTPGGPCDSNPDCAPGTCTFLGTCTPGTCTPGTAAICCPDHADPAKLTVCSEASPRCSEESLDAGVTCRTSADCKDGLCEHCQPSCTSDTDCDDGRRCNGTETCERTCVNGPTPGILCTSDGDCGIDGKCLGQCEPGVNPCGAGARCSEKDCRATAGSNVPPFQECLHDSDCPAGQGCFDLPTSFDPRQVFCYLGRCCEPGATGADEYTCNKKKITDCDNNPGALFYASDTGEHSPNSTDPTFYCGGSDARLGLSQVPWGCPKYTSGFTQLTDAAPPIYPVIVGPISESTENVPLPGGPGTLPLNQLGDDYKFFNEALCSGGPTPGAACSTDAECGTGGRCGSFLALTVLRYVGFSVTGGTRASIDFYDAQGNFIEDVITDSMASSLGINVVIFTPPLTIAPGGWMVMRVAEDFVPNMRFKWASTTAAGSAGSNDPDALWINGYAGPANTVTNNFLKMCDAGPRKNEACVDASDCPNGACIVAPGILAFELVGDKVADPVGACCTSLEATAAAGDCVDGVVSWVCFAQRNVYHGDGSFCQRCNGGTRAGQSCATDPVCPPTRKCVGGTNPGTLCPLGNECMNGGICTDQGTCLTGRVGEACPLGDNAACNEVGVCNLETSVCSNPHAPGCATDCGRPNCCTQACAADSECDIAGTCVPVSCTPIAACAQGACCDTTTGACTTVANPEGCTGTWQGYGTDCDADDGYDAAQQHCCPIPYYPQTRCMSGPNNNQICDQGNGDSDCRFCVGGAYNGEKCSSTSDTAGGTCTGNGNTTCVGGLRDGETCTRDLDCKNGCLDVGVCQGGMCVGGIPPSPNTCLTDSDCPDNSGTCRGRCVSRGTGGDNCEDAVVHVITVPALNEGPKTVTITGSNLEATSTEEEPDSFWDELTSVGDEPGWWEAFSIDKCARVRLDFCCSDPIAQPQWAFILSGCPEDPIGIGDSPDPYTPGQPNFRRGGPYCPDDNLWHTFGPLDPGTYYYPKYAVLQGSHGPYQAHITVQGCVSAACCFLECTGGNEDGQHCDPNTPCTGGVCVGGDTPGATCGSDVPCPGHCVVNTGTACTSTGNECQILGDTCDAGCTASCDSKCAELVKADCDAKLGYSLAPPNVSPAQPLCSATTCESGSCCTGPGICKDSRENNGDPVYKALCDDPAFQGGGSFIGGVLCKGGHCGCGADIGKSCSVDADCAGGPSCPGNPPTPICVGTSAQLAQANPCPVCEIEGSSNCQRWENSFYTSAADLGTPPGMKVADDFRLIAGGALETVCVWGSYLETNLETPTNDCGGPQTPGEQRADFFRVRVYDDEGGLPGPLLPGRESTCSRTKAVIKNSGIAALYGEDVEAWAFQLTLDNPINGLLPGRCYWLEVVNDTGTVPSQCTWMWHQLEPDSTAGNLFSVVGSEETGYGAESPKPWDMAFCLNLDVAAGACASQPRACCACQGGCTASTLADCDEAESQWNAGQSQCAGFSCPEVANDACADAEIVPVGAYEFTTHCATTDGFNPVVTDFGTDPLVQDIWYFFRAPTDCHLVAGTCASGQVIYDGMMALYHDPTNPSQCPCPLDQTTADRTFVQGGDENCFDEVIGVPAFVETDALSGHCYTIRVGGWPSDAQSGRGVLDISCGAPFCGDGRKNGDEECDGLDNADCRNANPSTLCDANCTCGALNPCGNGVVDPGEECDPNGGLPCGAPSICYPAGHALQCLCEPICGNDRKDRFEECDGADPSVNHPCPGRCRSSEVPPVCLCPPLVCGNGRLETLPGEECEFGICDPSTGLRKCSDPPYEICTMDADPICGTGKCLTVDYCSDDAQCGAGTCDLAVDRGDCDTGACRTPNDPLGGCRCGCDTAVILNNIVWDPATNPTPWPNSNPEATTRALRFRVVEKEPGPSKVEAIKATMVDLMHPDPRNLIQYPPPNYSTFDTGTASRCSGATTGPNRNGHHCTTSDPDCLGANGAVSTDDGTCSPTAACTAAGGCEVWVGQPWTFYEAQGPPLSGPYRASRLQCTPVYWDWKSEPDGLVTVIGAEILPSSEYSVQLYASTCMGSEAGCTDMSTPVTMYTRRKGDLDAPFQMPSPAALTQADVLDISQAVASVKHVGPAHYRGQMQPNLTELNSDANVLDIVEAVDSVKRLPYSFSGPCACPSTVTCGGSCTGCAGLCLKTCVGGGNAGLTCVNNTHCPGVCTGGTNPGAVCPSGVPGGVNCVGTCVGGGNPGAACTNPGTQCTGGGVCSGQCSGACGATGTCYDKCGRCNP